MSPPVSLTDCQVAIVGLGLMGGSLALALRGRCRALLACDTDLKTLQLAEQLGLVDRLSDTPQELLPQADLIVLAAPVRAILSLIHQLPNLLPDRPSNSDIIVIDLGSTKAEICQAYAELPPHIDPIGGHPMCGKEHGGLEHADGRLYQQAAFALTPIERTTPAARSLAAELVNAVGAYPLWLAPDVHDRWTASTSHMPYLLSTALTLATPAESAPLAGPGFRSASRLASSSPSMMADVLHTNRENVLVALHRCQTQLGELEKRLRQGDEDGLSRLLVEGTAARQRLLDSSPGRDAP
ncbi:MAG: prephenate dehydrogenase [Anaerolineales bacterium]